MSNKSSKWATSVSLVFKMFNVIEVNKFALVYDRSKREINNFIDGEVCPMKQKKTTFIFLIIFSEQEILFFFKSTKRIQAPQHHPHYIQ